MTRRAGRRTSGQPSADGDAVRTARKEAKEQLRNRGVFYWALRGVSALMYLDVLAFGRLRSGPFFARLRKRSGVVAPS